MRRSSRRDRGSILLVVIGLILVIGVTGVAMIAITGADSAATGQRSRQESAIACAEKGIQYGRRFFANNYYQSNQWNNYLGGNQPGRYDDINFTDSPTSGPTQISLIANGNYTALGGPCPLELMGDSQCLNVLDPGTFTVNNTTPDFLVTIRDDDDERPMGQPPNWTQNNNFHVILRSQCINPNYAVQVGGVRQTAVIEADLFFCQPSNASKYGGAVNNGDMNQQNCGP